MTLKVFGLANRDATKCEKQTDKCAGFYNNKKEVQLCPKLFAVRETNQTPFVLCSFWQKNLP